MSCRFRLVRFAASLAALLVPLTGCQQLATVRAKLAARKPAPESALVDQQPAPRGKLGVQQKADIQMAVAWSLERQGAVDQAIKAYLEVVGSDDTRADAYHRLAILHDKKGECNVSEKFYRAALQRDPHNAELHCDFGYSCYLQRRFPEAEASLRRAISLKPDLARAHNNLGLLLARTGRQEEALWEFAHAGCSEAEARANLAFASSLEGQWDAAREQYELALQLDPNSVAALQGLDAVRAAAAESGSVGRTVATEGSRTAWSAAAYDPGLPAQPIRR